MHTEQFHDYKPNVSVVSMKITRHTLNTTISKQSLFNLKQYPFTTLKAVIKSTQRIFMPKMWIVPSHLKYILLSERMSWYMQPEFTDWLGVGWNNLSPCCVISACVCACPWATQKPLRKRELVLQANSSYHFDSGSGASLPLTGKNTSSISPSLFDIRYRP